MSDGVDLSVVVPVYDNAATLDELIDRTLRTLEALPLSFELIFVDDGSHDASWEILRRHARNDPRIRAYAQKRNFGGQSAICAGFDRVRGKRTVCMDADLENLPEDIPALLAALDRGHDLACGVREQRRGSTLRRKLPSALFNAFVRRQIGTTVRDIGCGMRAMESYVVHDLAAEGEKRRLITPLLIRRARSVVEVPIRHQPSGAPSRHSFLTLLGIAFDFYLLTARRPFLVAGLVAAGALAVGLACIAAGLLGAGFHTGLVGLILAVGGLLGGLIAILGEYVQRSYQIGQGLPFYDLRPDERTTDRPAAGDASGRRAPD